MITKHQLAAGMTHECDVCQHLFTKLGPGAFDYRPSPQQRSTLELLRYLTVVGIAPLHCMAKGDWNLYGGFAGRIETMPADEFPAAMARQKSELEAWFAEIDEKILETQDAPLPGGGSAPLGLAILNGPFKWLAAYKLQLFLYAKAAGATSIGTANAWKGQDAQAT